MKSPRNSSTHLKKTSLAILLGTVAFIGESVAQTTVLSEGFSQADVTALTASGWVQTYGGNAGFLDFDSGASRGVTLNNRGINFDIPSTVTTDFTVSLRLSENNYGRTFYMLFTSDPVAGAIQGYGFRWDTSSVSAWGGQGLVQLGKFSGNVPVATTFTNSFTVGTGPGQAPNVQSGATIATPLGSAQTSSSQFNDFTLSWVASTGTLSLSVNGVAKTSVVDTAFSSFSHIYLSSGTGGVIDSLTITTPSAVPEPSTYAALLGASLLSWAATRRNRRQ